MDALQALVEQHRVGDGSNATHRLEAPAGESVWLKIEDEDKIEELSKSITAASQLKAPLTMKEMVGPGESFALHFTLEAETEFSMKELKIAGSEIGKALGGDDGLFPSVKETNLIMFGAQHRGKEGYYRADLVFPDITVEQKSWKSTYEALLRMAPPKVTAAMQGSRLAEGLPMPLTSLEIGAGENGEDTLVPLVLVKMSFGESFRIDPVAMPESDKHRVVLLGAKRRDNTKYRLTEFVPPRSFRQMGGGGTGGGGSGDKGKAKGGGGYKSGW